MISHMLIFGVLLYLATGGAAAWAANIWMPSDGKLSDLCVGAFCILLWPVGLVIAAITGLVLFLKRLL